MNEALRLPQNRDVKRNPSRFDMSTTRSLALNSLKNSYCELQVTTHCASDIAVIFFTPQAQVAEVRESEHNQVSGEMMSML